MTKSKRTNWNEPDIRDVHDDLMKLHAYNLYPRHVQDKLRAAADLLIAADMDTGE